MNDDNYKERYNYIKLNYNSYDKLKINNNRGYFIKSIFTNPDININYNGICNKF